MGSASVWIWIGIDRCRLHSTHQVYLKSVFLGSVCDTFSVVVFEAVLVTVALCEVNSFSLSLPSLSQDSPWYNRHGWLGVKNQLYIYIYIYLSISSQDPKPRLSFQHWNYLSAIIRSVSRCWMISTHLLIPGKKATTKTDMLEAQAYIHLTSSCTLQGK